MSSRTIGLSRILLLRRQMPLAVAIGGGCAVSALLFGLARGWEHERIRADFERVAENGVSALERELESNCYRVEAIGGFFAGSIEVTRQEFGGFTRPILARQPGIQALEWIPRVAHAQRAFYEEAARRDGFATFQITERSAQGQMVRAADRPEYFPAYFVEPYEGNEKALGFDLASSAERLEALQRSRDSGEMVATERIRLVQETQDQFGFLVYLPIYRKGEAVGSVERRRDKLDGFVLGVFRIGNILEKALGHAGSKSIDVCLYDMSASGGEGFLGSTGQVRGQVRGDAGTVHQPGAGGGLHCDARLAVAGREWLAHCTPLPSYVAARKTWQPWIILIGGLLVTVLLTGYMSLVHTRTIRARQTAAELLAAKQGLEREMAERVRAEAAVRESEEKYRNLVERANDGIAIVQDSLLKYANPRLAELTGYSTAEVVGRPFIECIDPQERPKVFKRYLRSLAGGAVGEVYETVLRRKDGTRVNVELNASLVTYDGRPADLVFVRDVTQRNTLQSQLVRAQKLESIGQLAAGIAHEINTPTQFVGDNVRFLRDAFGGVQSVVDTYTQTLASAREGAIPPEFVSRLEAARLEADLDYLAQEIPRAIEQALEGVDRVAKIVRAMREFSHPGGEEKLAVDLNKTIENTITVARNEWKYVAEMVTQFDASLPPVVCLPADMNQVILNLLINAAHAIAGVVGDGSKGKGTITVSTQQEGDWAEIRIRDTGTGIRPEIQSRIFDPFFTTKAVGKGTGQGLAIAHAIVVKKHGGTITFETEPGAGTMFIVRLPMQPESGASQEEQVVEHGPAYSI